MEVAVVVLVFVAVFWIVRVPFAPSADASLIQRRLHGARPSETVPRPDDPPFRARVLDPLVRSLGGAVLRLTPRAQIDRVAERLSQAGSPMSPAQFYVLRLAFVVLGISPVVLGGEAVLVGVVAGVLGYRLPTAWLDRQGRERRRLIGKMLPDALDLLCVSVEAGMGFDQALGRVAEHSQRPIRDEFVRVLSEMRFGRPRIEALKDLAGRVQIAELRQFVAAVAQAESLGVSLSRPLRVQADALRVKRRQRAEEAALKTPIKLLFPLVFLIFPSIFVVLLGPAILSFGQLLHP